MQQGDPWPLVSNWLLAIGAFILLVGAIGQAGNDMLEIRQFFGVVPQATESVLTVLLPFGWLIARLKQPWKAILLTIDVILAIICALPAFLYLCWIFVIRLPKEIARITDPHGDDAYKLAKAGR